MLSGKVALVTGAGGGIGRATAIMLGKNHAKVFITGRREHPLQETCQMVEAAGGVCSYCTCDVADEKEVRAMVSSLINLFADVDIVVNNAALFLKTDITELHVEDSWKQMLDVNVMGMVNVIHATVPYLMKKGGSIVNISSIDAFTGCREYTGYSATKGAVVSLTRGLAVDLGGYNIRVNAVAPGITDTPMTHERILAGKDKYLSRMCLQKIGDPEDIAGAVLFLASDYSAFITGEVINVNGGMDFA